MMADEDKHGSITHRPVATNGDGKALILAAIQARVGFYDALTRNYTHLEPRAARRALLDDELAAVDNSLADLRRRRNLLAPASACPPEVLTTIFHMLSDLEPNHYPDPDDFLGVVTGRLPPRLGWMKVIHVCYSWRRAAHTDGTLWSTVTTSFGIRYATAMLNLSKEFPVHLDIHTPADGQISPFSLLCDHCYRISSLQILCDGTELGRKQLHEDIYTSAPLLESLTIYTRGSCVSLSGGIFAEEAPKLQKLHLHNISPTWRLIGSQIAELTIIFDAGNPPYRVLGLLDILCNSPSLTMLCIKNCFIIDDALEDEDPLPVQCTRLLDITLHCEEITASMFILSHLVVHDSAKDIVVAMFHEYMVSDPIGSDLQTVEWRGYGAPHIPLRNEEDRVDAVYERTLTLSAWRVSRPNYLLADYAGYETPPPPDFRLTLGLDDHPSPLISPEDILPWPQPFTSARNVSLQMTKRYPFEVSSWSDVLDGLPSLRWLRVDRELAGQFLSDLSSDGSSMPKSVRKLALLGIFWGSESEESSLQDQMLANVWQETLERDGELESIIVGSVPGSGGAWHESVYEAEVVMEVVHRPDWLNETHEDWDIRTNW